MSFRRMWLILLVIAVTALVGVVHAKVQQNQLRRIAGLIEAMAVDDGNDETEYDYQDAANELGQIGRPAVPSLIKALEDKRWSVMNGAASALSMINDPRSVKPLIKALKRGGQDDLQMRSCVDETLSKIGKPAVMPLVECLTDKRWYIRADAASTLAQLKDVRSVMPLIKALGDKDESTRRWAADALGRIGDRRATLPLIGRLKDSDPDVRFYAAGALGQIADERAGPPLMAALKRQDIQMALASYPYFLRHDTADAAPLLLRMMRKCKYHDEKMAAAFARSNNRTLKDAGEKWVAEEKARRNPLGGL
jgi:HEAT repeat protein